MNPFTPRAALIVLVWLTAASTLLAGIPRFECVCPSKPREPSPSPRKAKGAGCCGSRGCCCCTAQQEANPAPAPGERRGKHGCCPEQGPESRPNTPRPTGDGSGKAPAGPHEQQAGGAMAGWPELTQPRCAKMLLAPSDGITATVSKADSGGWQTPEPLAPAAPCPVAAPSPCDPRSRLPWLNSHAPPPTDLVITFQHFVI